MKKIALCSSTIEWAVTFANQLMANSGVWFISFKDVITEWLDSGGKVTRKRQRPLGFIMPALEYLKKNYDDIGVVIFGYDTLLHADAEKEVKKEYKLVFLSPSSDFKKQERFDNVLHGEYSSHLEKIADVIVDCADMKKAVKQVQKLLL